jgi:hypothetical protein
MLNVLDVFVDGVRQIEGIQFTTSVKQLAFHQPPPIGTTISIKAWGREFARFIGDGCTYLYNFDPVDPVNPKSRDLMNLVNDLVKYHKNPTVSDVLDRLQVVINLVKEDETRQIQ